MSIIEQLLINNFQQRKYYLIVQFQPQENLQSNLIQSCSQLYKHTTYMFSELKYASYNQISLNSTFYLLISIHQLQRGIIYKILTSSYSYRNNIKVMYFLHKMKTLIKTPSEYFNGSSVNMTSEQLSMSVANKNIQKKDDAFQLLMLDMLNHDNNFQSRNSTGRHKSKNNKVTQAKVQAEQQKLQSLHSSDDTNDIYDESGKLERSEPFQDLIFEEDEHEQIENMYIKDFIFVNKLQEARELTAEQWEKVISEHNLGLVAKKNLYFSLFKGIKFQIRKSIWQVFANTQNMKKLTKKSYKQLIDPQSIPKPTLTQIDKDVPRSQSITSYTKQLRNILIGYCSLSGNDYTQGMNLIAGSLLTLLALENDEQLNGFEILEDQFEERVFWVFIGVMIEKEWQKIFQKDFQGLNQKLKTLEILMAEHTPAIYQRLVDYQWDLTIFSQFYITIMLYNSPINLSKIVLDLFFIQGQSIIHSLIIRMLKLRQDKILGFSDQCELMSYFKKDMILDCYNGIINDRKKAVKLEDFEMNFMKIGNNY